MPITATAVCAIVLIDLIPAAFAHFCVLTVSSGQKKTEHKLETAQAVTDCKIDELTREVRLHNNFAQRVPVMEEQIKVINHRIADLEGEK